MPNWFVKEKKLINISKIIGSLCFGGGLGWYQGSVIYTETDPIFFAYVRPPPSMVIKKLGYALVKLSVAYIMAWQFKSVDKKNKKAAPINWLRQRKMEYHSVVY